MLLDKNWIHDLKYFENFIIPINGATDELKYYYFISTVLKWMKKDNQNKSIRMCLII